MAADSELLSLDADAPAEGDAKHWEGVARRTCAVASQWRALHAAEVQKSSEARSTAQRAVQALRRAEEERDRAQQQGEAAKKKLTAAKAGEARWRARSETQTVSKSFVALSDARESLADREAALGETQQALAALRREVDDGKAASRREQAAREEAQRERQYTETKQQEDTHATIRALEDEVDALRAELSEQHASTPPGALAAARAALLKHEATIRHLEVKNHTLRTEAKRWRERTSAAVASERLVQLKGGAPFSMVTPQLVAPPPLAMLADTNRDARGGEGGHGDVGAGNPDDATRLRAERDWWRAEAVHEQQRQKAFHEALWASDAFTQAQKQKLTTWLRQTPSDPLY